MGTCRCTSSSQPLICRLSRLMISKSRVLTRKRKATHLCAIVVTRVARLYGGKTTWCILKKTQLILFLPSSFYCRQAAPTRIQHHVLDKQYCVRCATNLDFEVSFILHTKLTTVPLLPYSSIDTPRLYTLYKIVTVCYKSHMLAFKASLSYSPLRSFNISHFITHTCVAGYHQSINDIHTLQVHGSSPIYETLRGKSI